MGIAEMLEEFGMPVTYDPAAEAAFYASISEAPDAVRAFFDELAGHFRARSDTSVAYTFSNGRKGQMRIWAFWKKANGREGKRVTATLHWQSRNQAVFVRCLLTPPELRQRGFDRVEDPRAATETLKCDLWLDEGNWSNRESEVISALDASASKAGR
jgi:hypothetical protein